MTEQADRLSAAVRVFRLDSGATASARRKKRRAPARSRQLAQHATGQQWRLQRLAQQDHPQRHTGPGLIAIGGPQAPDT